MRQEPEVKNEYIVLISQKMGLLQNTTSKETMELKKCNDTRSLAKEKKIYEEKCEYTKYYTAYDIFYRSVSLVQFLLVI